MLDGDRVIGFFEGDGVGVNIPVALQGVPAGRLFVIDGAVVDGATLATLFIDGAGRKHAVQADSAWQALACGWSDAVKRDGEIWVVSDDPDDRRVAMLAAGGVPD